MQKLSLLIFSIFFLASLSFGQTFVGSDACKGCHSSKFNDWEASGHPYKFTVTPGTTEPTYPNFAVNYQSTWMDSLGDGSHDWSDVAGVIGGFGWKARFVGTDGNLIGTAGSSLGDAGGGHNQINFYGGEFHGWVDYHPNDVKIYNYGCFKCHTTGGDTTGTWLEGVDGLGTFSEGGVGCEGCHGPGSDHIAGPNKTNIDKVYEFAHQDNAIGGLVYAEGDTVRPDTLSNDVVYLCGTCHNRDYTYPINSSGGYIKHHEQWDEYITTKHFGAEMTCLTCHNPHKRVIWDGDGITKTCETCHSDQAATINHSNGATCIDCHMPFAAKSGTTRGQSGWKADVRSHLFNITADTMSMFTEDGSAVKDDDMREASLSPGFSCLGCHNDSPDDNIPDKTLAAAAAGAVGMHTVDAIVHGDLALPIEYALAQNYPNPFNPETRIEFSLPEQGLTRLVIYNLAGQMVSVLVDEEMNAGNHHVNFNAANLPSGVYFYTIVTQNYRDTKKMVLLK